VHSDPGDHDDGEVKDLPGVDVLLAAAVKALGGAEREGQQKMAAAVAEATQTGEHLLVQAGTGTGKSLAYLVPLVRHAVKSRKPVLVSTATLALQNQVVERDLPRLAEALAPMVGRRPTMQIVKGRANYLCLHKLDGGFPDDDALFDLPDMPGRVVTSSPASRLGKEVTRLREWAGETSTGDRDELVPGVSERAWRQVSVSARECLGQKCPQIEDCFAEDARRRAHEVDVVVTNHALLAIDAFEGRSVLPEHEVLVVDEAHELVDRVTSVVSKELSGSMVSAAASRARKNAGLDTSTLDQAADDLAMVIDELPPSRFARGLPENLAATVALVRDGAREALTALRNSGSSKQDADTSEGGRHLARAALTEVFDVAERIAADLPGDVVWLAEQTSGPGAPRRTLHVAPLSVARRLRQELFSDRTVVLTSATLTLGGSFDPAARQVGLTPPRDQTPARDLAVLQEREAESADDRDEDLDEVRWRGIDVGSPFDYPKQSILYVARHLPAPGRDGLGEKMLDELQALITAAGGRALGLFSSRRAAETAAEEMRDRLDVDVLCQGDDSTPNLVREFAAEPSTCLFGTLSLWQGVDVPGPSCQLVVIDRLPFPRPDDPLASARQEAISKAGGNGFMAVAAQHAALKLAQGAGRLIRSTSDRGVVAVLDSRLATARYGSYLLASLPPMWRTTDRQIVLSALRRLDGQAGAERGATL
jgi:ATP-dependent DNA helicase DinG